MGCLVGARPEKTPDGACWGQTGAPAHRAARASSPWPGGRRPASFSRFLLSVSSCSQAYVGTVRSLLLLKGLVCSGAWWALWPDTRRDQAAAGATQASPQLPGRIHGHGASHWSDSVGNHRAPLTVCFSLCPFQEQAASTRTGCSAAGRPHWSQAVLGDTGWY